MGASYPKKGLRFGMGFRNGLPKEIEAFCAKCPALFALIVTPAKITEIRTQLTIKGSAAHQALAEVEAFFKKDGE